MDPREVVFLVSVDARLVSEFRDALDGSPFALEGLRIDAGAAQGLKDRALPTRSLYAFDGALPKSVTEDFIGRVLSRHVGTKVLVVAGTFTESTAFPLLRAGVKGLLTYS